MGCSSGSLKVGASPLGLELQLVVNVADVSMKVRDGERNTFILSFNIWVLCVITNQLTFNWIKSVLIPQCYQVVYSGNLLLITSITITLLLLCNNSPTQ